MRVVLAAGKRGHYYLTARALQSAGVLHRFVTNTFFDRERWPARWLPRRRVDVRSDPELAGAPITSRWPLELGYRVMAAVAGRRPGLRRFYNDRFDRGLTRSLDGGDVFHVANTYGWRSMRAARARGMRVLVDQQSAHPDYLRETRERVYGSLGLAAPVADEVRESRIRDEIENADLVLAPSRFVVEDNARRGVERQAFVPIGVDTELFAPVPRRRRPGPLRVLFAGTASILKGTVTLLRALDRFERGAITCTWIGTVRDEMQPYLEAAERSPHLLPPRPQAQLADHYRDADVVCLPSHVEGSALVLYEAMACGTPCIATKEAGSVIRPGRDGWVVPAGDVDVLADALRDASRTLPRLDEMGASARERALGYDLADYGRRLLNAYADLEVRPDDAAQPVPERASVEQ